MKKNIFKKIVSAGTTAVMIAASVPSVPAVVHGADQQVRGNIGGYDYEMWNQNYTGQASMNPSAGSFTCSWSGIENFLARMGKNFDSQKKNYKAFGNIVLTYDVEYTPRGNSYMCVYGWTRNPLMEYYIVEGWGDWRPPGDGAERKGNVTLNGNTYDICKTMRYNQPSLDGTATFPQYWSIRQQSGSANNTTNYMKGTIDVSKHFDAWSQAGLDMSGTLYEVSLNIEGYRSNGQANVKSVTVTTGAEDTQQTNNNDNNNNDNNNNNQWGWPWGQQNDNNNNNNDSQGSDNVEVTGATEGVAAHQNLNYKYEKGGSGFKDVMGPYFRLGTSVSGNEIGNQQAQQFIKKNYNSVTCENEMKPDSIVAGVNGDNVNISLNSASSILKFAEQNGIGVRGHTFVWYSQTPQSLFQEYGSYVSKDRMNKRLESMIKNTFSAIKSQFPNLNLHSYDVCNELFVNDGGGMRPSYNSNWVRVYGEGNSEFVVNAFKYARQYAPKDCKLYLNDYNEYMSAKTNDLVNMAKTVMKEGDYIDGIGMQAHLDSKYPSASEFETAIKQFESLGLDVQITELDITNSTG
ncbi:endo-1,4-beta-xylanase, partial [Ruminococcus sp.]